MSPALRGPDVMIGWGKGRTDVNLTPGQKAAQTKRKKYGARGLSEIARRAHQRRTNQSEGALRDPLEVRLARSAGGAMARARSRSIPCEPNLVDWAIAQMRAQDNCCALSGVRFSLETVGRGAAPRPFAPSIDRIDAGEGYVLGNIRVVCWAVNCFLLGWGDRTAMEIARGMVRLADAGRAS